ncbi:MAG TPA: hypothetical protein PLD95_04685 [bacterium]|jgi:hypothetical protein|nr:hypothetical protein [bacterium]HOG38732.1 hypothetical protein [bacterium]HQI03480.1 hypothetical protein [bacterium]
MKIDKAKNILLIICLLIVLIVPIFSFVIAFYVSLFFIITGGVYIMSKKHLTLKNDRTILLVLFSLLIAIITSFFVRFFY